jgi:hypothetical protein
MYRNGSPLGPVLLVGFLHLCSVSFNYSPLCKKKKKKQNIALRIFSVIQNHVVARPLWDAHLVLKMDHHCCGRGEERSLTVNYDGDEGEGEGGAWKRCG